MAEIVVVGAGLAGCAAALELAEGGALVSLVERGPAVGGKVRTYGCKATGKCNNCGLCLAGGLWEKVENHPAIKVMAGAEVTDVTGGRGGYTLRLKGRGDLSGVDAVLVSTGFDPTASPNAAGISAQLQIEGAQGIVTGTEMEEQMLRRTAGGLFDASEFDGGAPGAIAFIQCFGSRDKKEDAFFCSRVCCGYSTRMARVVREYYPDCEIAFFYMELQAVTNDNTFQELRELGVEFIPFRPVRVRGGKPAVVEFEEPGAGMKMRAFDKIVLSEGIRPAADAARTADLFGLSQDGRGFLRTVGGGAGVYLAGCARTPMKIEETMADGVTAARRILAELDEGGRRA